MSLTKRILLILLAVSFVFAGTMHFVVPQYYVAMMPPFLPAHLALVYISGVAEIAGGLGVLLPATRRAAAWGLIALLVAVFPANIYVAIYDIPLFGATEGPGLLAWLRLPLQGVMILWAWWYTRP